MKNSIGYNSENDTSKKIMQTNLTEEVPSKHATPQKGNALYF